MLVSERGRGSGFFVSADGNVLTNAHVVANATQIRVMAQGGTEFTAAIAGIDADNDLALLKTEARDVSYFDLSLDVVPRQGQLVLAYGSPMGLAQSASLGLISALDRQLSSDDPRAYIQTDASMNPGNSGGPLVDLEGRILGINTMILSQSGGSEGLGFAIPLDVVRRSEAALRTHGSVQRAQLGLQPRSLTPELIAGLELKVRKGVLVEDVDPNGPASEAGVRPGDVIVGIGEITIRTLRDLYTAEYGMPTGQSDLAVMRGADMRFLHITPIFTGKPQPALAAGVTEKENLIFGLGVYAATLTPALAATMGGTRGGPGALVLALTGMTGAGQNAVEPGDVIHAVNRTAVDSVDALRAELDSIAPLAPVVLQIERAGVLSYVTPGALPAASQLKRTGFNAHSGTAPLLY